MMKLKFTDKIMDNFLKANYSALSSLSSEQFKILRMSIKQFKRLSAMDISEITKNEKFKVWIENPHSISDTDTQMEVDISFDQIDEMMDGSDLSMSQSLEDENQVSPAF